MSHFIIRPWPDAVRGSPATTELKQTAVWQVSTLDLEANLFYRVELEADRLSKLTISTDPLDLPEFCGLSDQPIVSIPASRSTGVVLRRLPDFTNLHFLLSLQPIFRHRIREFWS